MRLLRIVSFFVLLASLSCLLPPVRPAAQRLGELRAAGRNLLNPQSRLRARPSLIAAYHGHEDADTLAEKRPSDDQGGGIREVVPDKYKARYQEWRKEFLATETGRRQWAMYEHHTKFTLTIVVSRDNRQGAGTGKYKWDDSGKLIAATITLGSSLDEGYPKPIYFPVMNSLTPHGSSDVFDGDILAGAKIAHEFGHLTLTYNADPALYQLQSQLMPVYNMILMSNGRNTDDPRLIERARQMGGTPVEIWEDREYWGEANAMLYLRDRFTEESLRCLLFNRIKQRVDLYAENYADRFLKIARSTSSPNRCGW